MHPTIYLCTNGLVYFLLELVTDSFYLYLFSLLFAVFVRCTVELFVLVSSVCHTLDLRNPPEACFIRD